MITITDIKKQLLANKQSGIALDIDETLSWTIGHWVKELQKLFGNPENLTVEEMVKKYRYVQNIPYWMENPKVRTWLEEWCETDAYHETLPLIEDAPEHVWKIYEMAPLVIYLTGRPQSVLPGTRKWIAKHNLPPLEVVGRPDGVHHKKINEWKAGALAELYPAVTGIIDDNPALVDSMPKNYPGVIYLYDTEFHPRKDITVVSCKTWAQVYAEAKKRHS